MKRCFYLVNWGWSHEKKKAVEFVNEGSSQAKPKERCELKREKVLMARGWRGCWQEFHQNGSGVFIGRRVDFGCLRGP